MTTNSFIVKADSKKLERLDLLATVMHLSRNSLINHAIDQLLEVNDPELHRYQSTMDVHNQHEYDSDMEMEKIMKQYNEYSKKASIG